MNCKRAVAVLEGGEALDGAPPTAAEVAELQRFALVQSIEQRDLDFIDECQLAVRLELGGVLSECDLIRTEWVDRRLSSLEAQQRHPLGGLLAPPAVRWDREARRAELRRLRGVLVDHERAVALRALVTAPMALRTSKITVSGRLWAATDGAQRLLAALHPRLARVGDEPLSVFMKRFTKASERMAQAADAAHAIARGIGDVRKGKSQVVLGLMKTGLAPARAVADYDAAMVLSRHVDARSRPHVAVSIVRAARGGSVEQGRARLAEATQRLRDRLRDVGGEGRGALARAVVAHDGPHAIDRAIALCGVVGAAFRRASSDDVERLAGALMGARGEPDAIAARLGTVSARLSAPRRKHPRHPAVAVGLTAALDGVGSVDDAVARFEALCQALSTSELRHYDALDLALALGSCPGSPAEQVALILQLSTALAPEDERVRMAAALARRFAY